MNYYERHIGDYLKDTAHLSLLEHGVYARLLDVYYTREGGIPERDAARLIGARTKDERDALSAVLTEFFQLVEGTHSQARCEREIARYHDKQRKAKASADARWSKTSQHTEGNANAMRTHCEGNAPRARPQTPDTRHQTPQEQTPSTPDGVDSARPTAEAPAQLALVTKPKGPPDCPHLDVLALWAEVLPAMPQHLPSQWRGSRADHLRARWRETAVEKGWTSQGDGLAYLRRLFAYVATSAFLTGKAKPRGDGRPFVIELEWLVNPTNWAKVHEGKYHTEAA